MPKHHLIPVTHVSTSMPVAHPGIVKPKKVKHVVGRTLIVGPAHPAHGGHLVVPPKPVTFLAPSGFTTTPHVHCPNTPTLLSTTLVPHHPNTPTLVSTTVVPHHPSTPTLVSRTFVPHATVVHRSTTLVPHTPPPHHPSTAPHLSPCSTTLKKR